MQELRHFVTQDNMNCSYEPQYLDSAQTAWVTISELSKDLKLYGIHNFDTLYNLHPPQRGNVVMYDRDLESSRWHKSYGNTPAYVSGTKCSYMFSGTDCQTNSDPCPPILQPFLDYCNNLLGQSYNQVVVNWYSSGSDYIAQHSDHVSLTNPEVSVITLYPCQYFTKEDFLTQYYAANASIQREDDSKISTDGRGAEDAAFYPVLRTLSIIPRSKNENKSVTIPLAHGSIVTMGGATQALFKHSVPKLLAPQYALPRISITFRYFNVVDDSAARKGCVAPTAESEEN